jgi:hypothetical protein
MIIDILVECMNDHLPETLVLYHDAVDLLYCIIAGKNRNVGAMFRPKLFLGIMIGIAK